jgi:hypothetical protein
MFPTRAGDGTLAILSAMITPAVLILASGSLILTTSNRLSRVIDRVRELAGELGWAPGAAAAPALDRERRELLADLLKRTVERARLLQRALVSLYSGLSVFVATSIVIGVIELTRFSGGAVILFLGFLGGSLLFYASMLLIVESRRAVTTIFTEMEFLERRGEVEGVLEVAEKIAVETTRKDGG